MFRFNTADEWEAAYRAAGDEIRLAKQLGTVEIDNTSIRTLAVCVTNAAIRCALAINDINDISTYPGVVIEKAQ